MTSRHRWATTIDGVIRSTPWSDSPDFHAFLLCPENKAFLSSSIPEHFKPRSDVISQRFDDVSLIGFEKVLPVSKVGRPKSSSLTRQEQLRIAAKNYRRRTKDGKYGG